VKFTTIDLLAYGHFARRTLSFPANGPNLHLVHGPNEAGKSTLLRAITGFLYGIDPRTNDAHRFEASELRIGATVRHSDGRERYFIRRKANSGTLLDAEGRPVDDSQLADWLSVRERKLFEGMYGLNHEQLRRAGEALATSKQAVAEALFSAALEGSALRNTLTRLQEESEALLSPAGRAGEIIKAVRGWNELREAERDAQGSVGKWKQLQEELGQGRDHARALDDEIRKARVEIARLQRVARTLPWLRARADAMEHRAAMGSVRVLDPDMAQRRRELARERDEAQLAIKSIQQRIEKTRTERDELVAPEVLVAMGSSMQAFTERLGAYRKASHDRPGLVHEILPFRREAEEILRELGQPDLPLDQVESLRVPVADQERIRALQLKHATRVGSLEQVRARVAELDAERAEMAARIDGQTAPPDVAVLLTVWRQCEAERDIDGTLREAEGRRRELARSLASRAATLRLEGVDPATLHGMRVPSEESILLADREASRSEGDREAFAERRRDTAVRLDAARRELAALEDGRPVPSLGALRESRKQRDRLWQEIRLVCGGGLEFNSTVSRTPPPSVLLESFADAVERADQLADALRDEASRVARHAELMERCREAEGQALAAEREAEERSAADGRRLAAWVALWKETGLVPTSPGEMLSWRTRWTAMVDEVVRFEAANAECARLALRLAEMQRAVASALDLAGIPTAADLPWATLRAMAEHAIDQASIAAQERTNALSRLAELERDVARSRSQRDEAEVAVTAWHLDWRTATERFATLETMPPEAAAAVLDRLARLFKAVENRGRLQKRIGAMEKDIADFEKTLDERLERSGLSPTGSAVDRAEALRLAVTKAQRDADRRGDLDRDLDRLELERIGFEERHERAESGFRRLFEEAGCEALEALDEAEVRSDAARAYDARRAEAESRLADLGEGWTLEELEGAAAGQDSDRIRETLEALQVSLEEREEQRRAADLNLGELRGRDAAYSAGDEAARRLQDRHAQAERARSLAGRYARLHVAIEMLRRATAKYQEESQGAVMKRAEALFSKLTRGRYERLRVEFEGEGATIRCVRGGEAVQVKERVMSDGTLDQLYLALRLASIEQYLTDQEPMPLVLDDIFINFDDGRAQAGIEVLAEFARKTQVLLFTHHGRNLELARQVLAPGTWSEVQLNLPG